MKKKRDYIDEITELQENQYNPGHYLGGRMPPGITRTGSRKSLGVYLLISGFVSLIIYVTIFYNAIIDDKIFSRYQEAGQIYGFIVTSILLGGLIILFFTGGIRQILRGKRSKKHNP